MPVPRSQLVNTFRCHRDWSSMPTTANGRHCGSCKKTVHDFTGMEPAQILEVLRQNAGSVCGCIEAHKVTFRPELHARNQRAVYRIGHWYRTAAAAVSAFLMLVAGKAHGQDTNKPATGQLPGTPALSETASKLANIETAAADTVKQKEMGYVLKGTVTDAATGETIPFANVVLKQKGKLIGGAACDFDGNYKIAINSAQLNGQTVDVEVSYIGYTKKIASGLALKDCSSRPMNVKLDGNDEVWMGEVEIIYVEPILSEHDAGTHTLTKETIRKSPTRDINEMLQTQPGVFGR